MPGKLLAILVLLLGVGGPGAGLAATAELIMFESESCLYCERWHAEIGPAYPKTSEGRRAPLRRVDIDDPRPKDLASIKGIVFTPTFVLWRHGKEVGRFAGYPGEIFFWPMLAELLKKLPAPARPAKSRQ